MSPENVKLMRKAQNLIKRADEKRNQAPTRRCKNPPKVADQMVKKGKGMLASLNVK
jgi:hypothetical protein